MKIGIFDSGMGGLSVLHRALRMLPEADFLYYADEEHVPYGEKTREQVRGYIDEIIAFMIKKQVDAIVIACNTASAYTLETIEKEVDVPVIGVIKPGAKTAAESTVNGRIGVIATEATISSGLYPEFIRSLNPKLKVFSKACPLFCPLVEEGLTHDFVTEEIARRYLADLQQKDIMNVRRAVDANIGRRVRVRANKGRHKYSVAEGVIQESYPSIFTVRINADEDNAERVVSYSYTDVLTRDVQLVICK